MNEKITNERVYSNVIRIICGILGAEGIIKVIRDKNARG